MKKILFFISYLVLTNCFAENWLNHSKIKAGSIEAYSLKTDCERISGESCFDLGNYPSSVFSEFDIEVDDLSKPTYSKNEVQQCSNNEECDQIHLNKICSNELESSIKNYELLEVYCSRFLGYEKKLEKTIQLDQAKFSAWQSQKANEETARLREDGIQRALKRINCGERVVALMVLRNSSKTLTTTQIGQVNQTYGMIRTLLGTGSLVTAREQMAQVAVDGVMVTSEDKSELLSETDLCIASNP